jgi:hypothetical protein
MVYCTNKKDGELINFQVRLADASDSSKTLDLQRFGPPAITNATTNCTESGLPSSAAIRIVEVYFSGPKIKGILFT